MYASLSLGRTIMYASLSLDCDRAHYMYASLYASLSLDYDRAHYNVCKPFARL